MALSVLKVADPWFRPGPLLFNRSTTSVQFKVHSSGFASLQFRAGFKYISKLN